MDLCFDAPGGPSDDDGNHPGAASGAAADAMASAALAPALLLQMADTLAWPLLLLHADGRLLHANRAARELLQHRSPLVRTPTGVVEPAQARRRAGFRRALLAASDSAPGAAAQVLHWADGHASAAATTALLSRLHDDPRAQAEPLLLLALSSPLHARQESVRLFAQMHGLSPAETRVLQRLALGDDSRATAAALGVSIATVRTQILSLRRKTGHGSVAAVLRALGAMPPLLPAGAGGER